MSHHSRTGASLLQAVCDAVPGTPVVAVDAARLAAVRAAVVEVVVGSARPLSVALGSDLSEADLDLLERHPQHDVLLLSPRPQSGQAAAVRLHPEHPLVDARFVVASGPACTLVLCAEHSRSDVRLLCTDDPAAVQTALDVVRTAAAAAGVAWHPRAVDDTGGSGGAAVAVLAAVLAGDAPASTSDHPRLLADRLHDGPLQELTVALLHLDAALTAAGGGEAGASIERAAGAVARAADSSRAIMHELAGGAEDGDP